MSSNTSTEKYAAFEGKVLIVFFKKKKKKEKHYY